MLAVLSLSPETIDTLFSLAFGFAVAGLCASGYCMFSYYPIGMIGMCSPDWKLHL